MKLSIDGDDSRVRKIAIQRNDSNKLEKQTIQRTNVEDGVRREAVEAFTGCVPTMAAYGRRVFD